MRLSYIKFSGYKRFKDENTLNLNSKMIALIGPNEAGKTSTLKLLKHINHDEAFSIDDSYKFDDKTTPHLLACFFLEKKDYAEIGSSAPRKLIIQKDANGARSFSLEPKIKREKKDRQNILVEIKKSLYNKTFLDYLRQLDLEIEVSDFLEKIEGIDLKSETLEEDDLSIFGIYLSYIPDENENSIPKYILALQLKIADFLIKEKAEHPNDVAINLMKNSVPKVIEFTSDDRTLETTYNMMTYKSQNQQQRKEPCNA